MMKKSIISLFAFFVFVSLVQGQEVKPISTKMGIGFQVGQIQDNFGIGLNLTSPYLFNENIAVRLRGNLMWNEYVQPSETTWSPYGNAMVGLVSKAGVVGNFMRLYGEGGVIFLLPNTNFSTVSLEAGGYGLFGFEFFFDPHFNYFIEIGGVGTGATADKIVNKPIYSNGLLINAGFRAQF